MTEETQAPAAAPETVTEQLAPEAAAMPETTGEPDPTSNPPSEPLMLGYVATHPTAAGPLSPCKGRMKAFPVMPGFSDAGPLADLRAAVAKGEGWSTFRVLSLADGSSVWLEPFTLPQPVEEDAKAA